LHGNELGTGVIQDVISQVKEAFLDENVDIDVLSQLKKVGTRVFFLRVVFQGEGVQCSADDDDDPIRRIADRIGDGQIEDGEQIVEEDPLNSGDDQSDDEDLETLFDADNVIMCQFEKVHRARSKWKFQLKDGIMHIDNKDYCFQKCSGEAEW
uniref:Transcription initiation factor IIA subunit 1-like n=1 Tax=Heligmosomoides polygyrus TaxID=6339 RepID=A0A183FRD6_HELPZ